jgi:Uncharacterized membrane-associated protein
MVLLNFITDLLNQYGYIVLFIALTLELIAFPTPGETLMIYCGFLTFQGKLNWGLSIFTASMGIICGITISYFIGFYLGSRFFKKHGSRLHMGPERMEKAKKWFERYGNGLLIVAYFIPGIRHITGYFSGITKIPYKRFAINAYIGAVVWSGTFISLGKVLGVNWEKYHAPIKKYFIILAIMSGLILLAVYLFKSYKGKIQLSLDNALRNSIRIFHSLGKIRIVLVCSTVLLIALAFFTGGLIQDFLANEFIQFNEIANFAVHLIFTKKSAGTMNTLAFLSSYQVLIPVIVFTALWIIVTGKDKMLEIRFLLLTTIGSELLEEVLRRLFHQLNPASSVSLSFPSEQSFLAVVVYGFAAFIICRHAKAKWLSFAAVIVSFFSCISSGLGILYIDLQKPSDILAGYVFGSFILCIMIILLEVNRILAELRRG